MDTSQCNERDFLSCRQRYRRMFMKFKFKFIAISTVGQILLITTGALQATSGAPRACSHQQPTTSDTLHLLSARHYHLPADLTGVCQTTKSRLTLTFLSERQQQGTICRE